MDFEDIQDMTIQDLIDFYIEIADEGGASWDPESPRALAVKQEAISRAFGETTETYTDEQVLEQLQTML